MASSELRMYLDNEAADAEMLARFGEIRVDQGIGMASEAELHLDLSLDEEGLWDGMEESFAQPGARIRIEVKVGEGEFVPLIDGPIVGNRFSLGADAGESEMIIVVQDDGVLLNLDESVALFEDLRADEIAAQLFDAAGMDSEVDAVPDAGNTLERFVVQRGTSMQLLKELARRHGMFVYVKPGAAAGDKSIGVFKYPSWQPGDLPELLLLGAERNVAKFSAELDALKPLTAAAYSVSAGDKTMLTAEMDAPDVEALGDEAVHDVLAPARTVLSRTREEQSDLDAATVAAVNLSSFAFSAAAQVTADVYDGVLQPYQIISIAGVGGYLSGDYLISRVTHAITDDSYQQEFELKRNARSAGSGGGGGGVPGGIL